MWPRAICRFPVQPLGRLRPDSGYGPAGRDQNPYPVTSAAAQWAEGRESGNRGWEAKKAGEAVQNVDTGASLYRVATTKPPPSHR